MCREVVIRVLQSFLRNIKESEWEGYIETNLYDLVCDLESEGIDVKDYFLKNIHKDCNGVSYAESTVKKYCSGKLSQMSGIFRYKVASHFANIYKLEISSSKPTSLHSVNSSLEHRIQMLETNQQLILKKLKEEEEKNERLQHKLDENEKKRKQEKEKHGKWKRQVTILIEQLLKKILEE